jgi:hypothetical protein
VYSFQKSEFKKIIEVLWDRPDQVRSNAQDFAQLATMLRAVADNANLLAAAISTALTLSPASESTSGREEHRSEKRADQTDSNVAFLANEETEPQKSEPESLTPDAPTSMPPSVQKEKTKGKLTPRKVNGSFSIFVAGESNPIVENIPTIDAAWDEIDRLNNAGSLLLASETSRER